MKLYRTKAKLTEIKKLQQQKKVLESNYPQTTAGETKLSMHTTPLMKHL